MSRRARPRVRDSLTAPAWIADPLGIAALAFAGYAAADLILFAEPFGHLVGLTEGRDAFQRGGTERGDAWAFVGTGQGMLALLLTSGQAALWTALQLPA